MTSKSAVLRPVAPWRVRDRQELLAQFMGQDLDDEAAVRWLCALTGRLVQRGVDNEALNAAVQHALERSLRALGLSPRAAKVAATINPGPGTRGRLDVSEGDETGECRLEGPVSGEELANYYKSERRLFEAVRHTLAELKLAEAENVRERRSNEQGAQARVFRLQSKLGRLLEPLDGLLVDVRLAFERRSVLDNSFGRSFLRTSPLRLQSASESLAGELALAFSEFIQGVRWAGRCAECNELWLGVDGRGSRKLCSSTCRDLRRQRTRKPERPGSSTARAARTRARKKSVLAARS